MRTFPVTMIGVLKRQTSNALALKSHPIPLWPVPYSRLMTLPMPRRINYQIGSQQEACMGCGPGLERVECLEPHCAPSKELTAQCTDQCVVIACSDPNHAESICGGDGTHTHCDLDCDETIDCTDCHGFDAFVSANLSLRTCPS